MPKFTKKALSQYLRTQCERQLVLNLYLGSERKARQMPPEIKLRGQIGLIQEEGDVWQEKCVESLSHVFGTQCVIGTPRQGYQHRYVSTPLEDALARCSPHTFLVEPQYNVDNPAIVFRQALGLDSITDYQNKPLEFGEMRPDLIHVGDPQTHTFTHFVLPDGTTQPIPQGDTRRPLRIIDIKLTSEPGAHYFAEVAYYAMTLAGWLQDKALDGQYYVVSEAALWPGSHSASNLRRQLNQWNAQAHTPTYAELYEAMSDDLETVEFDAFAPMIRRFLQKKLPTILQEQNWQNQPWHVTSSCSACDFLGYVWGGGRPGATAPNPLHCWQQAQAEGHLSQIPFLNRGACQTLRKHNINNVATLAQHDSNHTAFDHHHELKAGRTVTTSRAEAVTKGTAFIAPQTGRSVVMPKWADLQIYISTEFDLSSGISFSFAIKGFWREPSLSIGVTDARQTELWKTQFYPVPARKVEDEQSAFLAFLRKLQHILATVINNDVRDTSAGRRRQIGSTIPTSSVQIYLWDAVQQKQFLRVMGRHLEAVLADTQLRNLAWLFPTEELVPNPNLATRKSAITLVNDVVRAHLAAPVVHAYTLIELAKCYHRQQDAPYIPDILEFFRDPLNDLIPSERGHEIWSQKQADSSGFPGFATRMQQFQATVEKKLNALEIVTKKLREDLENTLSDQSAPAVTSLVPPQYITRISWDGQLWLTYTKLNAAMDALETQQIRALPPHTKEAKFKSARLERRLEGGERQQALQSINKRLNTTFNSSGNYFVYTMREGSCDVGFKVGDYNVAISPESSPELLERKVHHVLSGTSLETTYQQVLNSSWKWETMQGFLKVNIDAIDRENLLIVLSPSIRYRTAIIDLENAGILDFKTDVVLDPTEMDVFTHKLKKALQAIGNPSNATTSSTLRRVMGQTNGRGANATPASPAGDFLWEAPRMHQTTISCNAPFAQSLLEQRGFPLNPQQWNAVRAGLTRRLSLIWGPPGTGKSRTLHRLALGAILERLQQPNASGIKILITASTYTAVDNVWKKVAESLQNIQPQIPVTLKRIRSTSRVDILEPHLAHADLPLNTQDANGEGRQLRALLENNAGIFVIGTTPQQIYNLMQAGTGQNAPLQLRGLFDLIILDEGSQMETAQAILTLCALKREGRVVIAGDHLQLAPIVKAEPPLGFKNKVGSIYDFFKEEHKIDPIMLETNYRSNQEIVGFAHCAKYGTNLAAHSPNLRLNLLKPLPVSFEPAGFPSHLCWSSHYADLLHPDKPVACFVHDDVYSSQSNVFEADAIAAMVWLLRERLSMTNDTFGLSGELDTTGNPKPVADRTYSETDFWERGVGIVSPHKAQMGKIVSALSKVFPQTNQTIIRNAVDTVERYQGQERDVILCSFGLGDPDAIRNEEEFLYNLNRFNVMASRAKAKLIVLVAQTVVDHLANDIDVLRSSRLLKQYADHYCNKEQSLQFDYWDTMTGTQQREIRKGTLKWK